MTDYPTMDMTPILGRRTASSRASAALGRSPALARILSDTSAHLRRMKISEGGVSVPLCASSLQGGKPSFSSLSSSSCPSFLNMSYVTVCVCMCVSVCIYRCAYAIFKT